MADTPINSEVSDVLRHAAIIADTLGYKRITCDAFIAAARLMVIARSKHGIVRLKRTVIADKKLKHAIAYATRQAIDHKRLMTVCDILRQLSVSGHKIYEADQTCE